MICAGQTGSGKSFFTKQLLQNKKYIFAPGPPKHVILFYREWQKLYDEMKSENLVNEFVKGMPEEKTLKKLLEKNVKKGGSLIIFDDLMSDIGNTLSNCFTVYSHHYNTTVLLLIQSLFLENKAYRICSLNSHYIILMKNKRDGASVSYLARQISPYNTKYITKAYAKATEKPYSYLLFDLRQETNDLIRIRNNIFDTPISIFIDIENKEHTKYF
jgi:ribonucleotide reductase alpha subunit